MQSAHRRVLRKKKRAPSSPIKPLPRRSRLHALNAATIPTHGANVAKPGHADQPRRVHAPAYHPALIAQRLVFSKAIVARTVALLSAWKIVETAQYVTAPNLLTGWPFRERYPYQSTAELMPCEQFVLQILLRSCVDSFTLETAFCYLAAATIHLPGLIRREQDKIYASYDCPHPPAPITEPPSPILCARRTFVAALVLASKFWNDHAHSNKAWVAVTGLSALEISHCERELCKALNYRLWVRPEPSTQALGSFTVITNEILQVWNQIETNVTLY